MSGINDLKNKRHTDVARNRLYGPTPSKPPFPQDKRWGKGGPTPEAVRKTQISNSIRRSKSKITLADRA